MLQLQAGCLFSFWLTALIWMLQCINKKINSLYHKVGHVIYLFDKKPSASAVHSLLSPLVNSCKVWTKEKKDKYQDEKKTPIQNGLIDLNSDTYVHNGTIASEIKQCSKSKHLFAQSWIFYIKKIQCQVLFSLYAFYRLRFCSELIMMMQLFGKTVPWIELHTKEGSLFKVNKCNFSIILRCISEVICSPSKTNHPKPIPSLCMTRKVRSKQL